jgi:Ca2+-binding RTX toxin-like protein
LQITAPGQVDLTNAVILAIDEMRGTSGADTFLFAAATGNITVNLLGGADSVSGGDGNDVQLGGNGNDTLVGGAGQDELWGQAGTDNLTGGLGADVFVFSDLSEVGLGGARDVITDFVHGQDIIRLTQIDANLNLVDNQQFTFIGGSTFGKIAGELRYSGGVLAADLDADGKADFQIALTGAPELGAADFQL